MRLSPATRSSLRIVVILNATLLLFGLLCRLDLLTQLNDARLSHWQVTQAELASLQDAPDLVPRIIHQTYKTADIPEQWLHLQQSIKDMNPDYKYILWTDEDARKFIAEQYPWFLETYDAYRYPIMRADAIRYFVLHHFGGFYLDMDIGLRKPLDELLKLPATFYRTAPTGVSNDFMVSAPKHPFFTYVVHNIARYRLGSVLPYLTVMYSTGSLFVSIMLQRYNLPCTAQGLAATRILQMHGAADSVHLGDFLFHGQGSTWHEGDSWLFILISEHMFVAITGLIVLGTALVVLATYVEMKLLMWAHMLVARYRAKPSQVQSRYKEA